MSRTVMLISAILVATFVACNKMGLSSRTVYRPDEIKILGEGITDRGVVLWFRAPAETLYYCPGARYRTEGTDIHYELVRSSTTEEQAVDVKARLQKDGSLKVTFPFPGGEHEAGDVVQLVDSNGRGHGRWKAAGTPGASRSGAESDR